MVGIIRSVLKLKLKFTHVECKRIMMQVVVVEIDVDRPLNSKSTVFFELVLHIQVGLAIL